MVKTSGEYIPLENSGYVHQRAAKHHLDSAKTTYPVQKFLDNDAKILWVTTLSESFFRRTSVCHKDRQDLIQQEGGKDSDPKSTTERVSDDQGMNIMGQYIEKMRY